MNAKLLISGLLSIYLLIAGGCAGLAGGVADNETATIKPVLSETPTPQPEEIIWPGAQVDEFFPANPGWPEPRELTQQEKDLILQVALQTKPAQEALSKGIIYRSYLWWQAKSENGIWFGFYYGQEGLENINFPEWYPSMYLEFGSPLELELWVAVDMQTAKPVLISYIRQDYPPFPHNYLTEEEKIKVLEIASRAAGITDLNSVKIEFVWYAIVPGQRTTLDYNVVERGIPDLVGVRDATYYPGVVFHTPAGIVEEVGIDLQDWTIVVRDSYPVRTGPAINPNLEHK